MVATVICLLRIRIMRLRQTPTLTRASRMASQRRNLGRVVSYHIASLLELCEEVHGFLYVLESPRFT